jgi:hypothetical protein
MGMSRRFLILAAALLPATSFGQAWLPDKGVFNATLIYNDVSNLAHWGSTWDAPPQPDGSIDVKARTLAFLGTYGITDRWMVSAALPYVNTRYKGPPSHRPPGTPPGTPPPAGFEVDNGEWHGSLTDLRVGLHFQALERPFALAPFVGYVMPVTDYYTRGHAATGRHLEETLIGLSVGKSLDPWIPRTYAQARYSYAFVEKVAGITHDRDNLNVELGTFFTPRWNASLYGAWQWTHGGLTFPLPPGSPHFFHHDQVGEDEFFNAGFGTGFAVTEEMTLFAIYMEGIEGKNGHKIDQGLTFGISYGFRPRASAVFAEESSTSK